MDESLNGWAAEIISNYARKADRARKKAARDPADNDCLHDARTSARRLRAALEDLDDLVDDCDELRYRVKRIGDCTGRARDAMVLRKRMREYIALCSGSQYRCIESALKKLQKDAKKDARDVLRRCRLDGS